MSHSALEPFDDVGSISTTAADDNIDQNSSSSSSSAMNTSTTRPSSPTLDSLLAPTSNGAGGREDSDSVADMEDSVCDRPPSIDEDEEDAEMGFGGEDDDAGFGDDGDDGGFGDEDDDDAGGKNHCECFCSFFLLFCCANVATVLNGVGADTRTADRRGKYRSSHIGHGDDDADDDGGFSDDNDELDDDGDDARTNDCFRVSTSKGVSAQIMMSVGVHGMWRRRRRRRFVDRHGLTTSDAFLSLSCVISNLML